MIESQLREMIRQMLAEESEMNESGDLVGKKSKDTLISPSDKKEWSEHVAELRKTLTKLLKNLENSEDESLGDTIETGIKSLRDWKSEIDMTLAEGKRKKKKKLDRCALKAKNTYDVWPSAYASGAAEKCRQGKIWKKSKKESIEEIDNKIDELLEAIEEKWSKKYKRSIDCDNPKGFSQKAHCQGRLKEDEVIEEKKKTDFSKEKEQGLHGWFARQGGKGKSKGWVDCNTCRKNAKTGRKTCKSCGRKEGEKRAKYPACRPTPGACKSTGKGNSWGKKAADE
jgi:hypothetical protein